MQKMTGPIIGCAVSALALSSVSFSVLAEEDALKPVAVEQPGEQTIEAETLDLLARANGTFKDFIRDPDMTWFQDNLHRAKGLVVIPTFYKGGFIIGASGGKGVMMARDRGNGEWLGPVFYSMGGVSLGLQIGGQSSEIVLMIMTDKGLDSMLSTKVQLGASASIAAGPVGKGAEAGLADVYSFARSKGAFAGVSLDGAVMTTSDKRNTAYYGVAVSPVSVLVTKHNAPATPPAVVQSVSFATRAQ
jgi:lipid-binding SYLF domain-containing protein